MKYRRTSLEKVMALNKFLKSECLCIFSRMHVLINAVASFPNIQQQCSLWKMLGVFFQYGITEIEFVVISFQIVQFFTLLCHPHWLPRFWVVKIHAHICASFLCIFLFGASSRCNVGCPNPQAASTVSGCSPEVCSASTSLPVTRSIRGYKTTQRLYAPEPKQVECRRKDGGVDRRRQGFRRHQQEFKVMKLF